MDDKHKTSKSSDGRFLFGEWLVDKGHLTHRKLCEALSEQHQHGGRLGEVLLRLKMLAEDAVAQALAEYLDLEYVKLDSIAKVDPDIARLIPEKIASRFCLIGIKALDDQIVIAMSDPLNIIAIDTVAFKVKYKIKVVVSASKDIRTIIDTVYHGSHIEEQRLRDLVEIELEGEEQAIEDDSLMEADIREDEEAATKAPVIRFVDLLLGQAVKRRASDIHLEPQDRNMIVRLRIDGTLRETVPPPRSMQLAVVTRVKILSGMNIAERRLPQDGRFKIKATGRDIDVRVSALPTIYGEKIVMRILDKAAVNHDLDVLGFGQDYLDDFKRILSLPFGIVIVTGPTGSGKTTTLYSALNYLKDPAKNITTVENPVEYRLEGINQVQVRPDIDLGFAECLRTILRQDPDIILIGEIRDRETVEIAMQASLTGHMVLTTFHTNDAPSAITRLLYMGIESYLLTSSLNLIIAQRLVRKICESCKEVYEPDDETLARLRISPYEADNITFYHGTGCQICDNCGYSGRTPIFEFLLVNDTIRAAMTNNASEYEIRNLARQAGGGSLLKSGIEKMVEGITSAEEVLKVAYSGDHDEEDDPNNLL